jgi:hypothetical protein
MLVYTEPKAGTETTLNDIPEGTVFFGTVHLTDHDHAMDRTRITGIWIRTSCGTNRSSTRHNVYAFSISNSVAPGFEHTPCVAVQCERVTNFRLLTRPRIVEG